MKSFGKLAFGAGGLIALYLIVYNSSGAGRVLTAGASGSQGIIKTLQGR